MVPQASSSETQSGKTQGSSLEFQVLLHSASGFRLEANGRFFTDLKITASNEWQSIQFRPDQLKHAQLGSMKDWSEVIKLVSSQSKVQMLRRLFSLISSGWILNDVPVLNFSSASQSL